MKRALRNLVRRLVGLSPHFGHTTISREQMLWLAMEYVAASQRVGNYAEFGVWRGDTIATAYHYTRNSQLLEGMRFFAFDSFEGFPELKGGDVHSQFRTGGRAYSLQQFHSHIQKIGVPKGTVTAVPGWFSASLAPGGEADRLVPDCSLAIAWVDCDLYESTRDALPFVFRKLRPGGLVIFDDWYCFEGHPMKGEQRAVRELLEADPTVVLVPFHRFGWHGTSLIFHHCDEPIPGARGIVAC